MFKNKQRMNELKETFSSSLKEQQDSLENSLNVLNEKVKKLSQEVTQSSRFSKYTILNPDQSSKYLLPIDQPPSSSYFPRYGQTHAPLKNVENLFIKEKTSYAETVKALFKYLPHLQKFAVEYLEQNLPAPALHAVEMPLLDICLLYTYVVEHQPKYFVEIGSGLSTCIVKQAIKDHKLKTEIVTIDPNIHPKIKEEVHRSIEKPLEQDDLSIFQKLTQGDIVYCNTSHRSFMNSDVTVFMLEILPDLKPGVLVQMNEVYLPFDYPSSKKQSYWNEQYALAIYLMASKERVKVNFPGHYICSECPDLNKELKYFLLELKDLVKSTVLEATPKSKSIWFSHQS